jgi:hypothetical protein
MILEPKHKNFTGALQIKEIVWHSPFKCKLEFAQTF